MNVRDLVDRVQKMNPDLALVQFIETSGTTLMLGTAPPVALAPVKLAGAGPGGDIDKTASAFHDAILAAFHAVNQPLDKQAVIGFEAIQLPITTTPAEIDPTLEKRIEAWTPASKLPQPQDPRSWTATVTFGIGRNAPPLATTTT